jgi:hypothetical protein
VRALVALGVRGCARIGVEGDIVAHALAAGQTRPFGDEEDREGSGANSGSEIYLLVNWPHNEANQHADRSVLSHARLYKMIRMVLESLLCGQAPQPLR